MPKSNKNSFLAWLKAAPAAEASPAIPQTEWPELVSVPGLQVFRINYGNGRVSSGTVAAQPLADPYFLQASLGAAADFIQGIFGPAFELFNKQVFPGQVQFLSTLPPADRHKYVFTLRFCKSGANGMTNYLVLQTRYLNCTLRGWPVLSEHALMQAGGGREQVPMQQTIAEYEPLSGNIGPVIETKPCSLQEEKPFFSKREREILVLSMEGLTYKAIAARLFIAEGTVIQHRKKLLKKSGTRNIAELVAFAIRMGYL